MFNGLNQFSHTPINLLTYSLIASFPQDDINKLIAPGGSCKNNPKDEFSKEELCDLCSFARDQKRVPTKLTHR